MMVSGIEALLDRARFVKFASGPAWNFVQFSHYEVPQRASRLRWLLSKRKLSECGYRKCCDNCRGPK